MAVKAAIFHDDGYVAVDLYPDQGRERIESDPGLPGLNLPVLFFYDAQKLARGGREILGISVLNVADLEEHHIDYLERLDLPRVDCVEAGLCDATIGEVLRWAKRAFPGRPAAPSRVTTG